MGADYVPERDADADPWFGNFARQLVDDPETYRTTPDDAAEVFAAYEAWHAAYLGTLTPGIISSPAIRLKNDARCSIERVIRPAYQRVRTNPRIDDAAKVRAGVTLTAKRRRYVGPPEGSVPVLRLERDQVGRVHILVIDSATWRKSKPKAAAGFELYERIRSQAMLQALREQGADPEAPEPMDVALAAADAPVGRVRGGWRYVGTFTATPIILGPAIDEHGDEVTYCARWVSRRGEPGAWGQPVSIYPMFNPMCNAGNLPNVQRRSAA